MPVALRLATGDAGERRARRRVRRRRACRCRWNPLADPAPLAPRAGGLVQPALPGSTVEPVPAFMLPAGTRVPEFDPSGGSRNWLGVFLLTAADAPTLLRDCRSILDGLEGALAG
jgi:hypothetical protein